jgi:hypothetical protein
MWRTAFKICFQIQVAPLHIGNLDEAARREGEAGEEAEGSNGRAVQVDFIKPASKATGMKPKLLKLRCDELLSNVDELLLNVAFSFNLRRYMMECQQTGVARL